MSEVEEWLESIGAGALYKFFLEDGFTSLEAVRQMRQSDIDAIVDRKGYMIILNEGIDNLGYNNNNNAGNSYYSYQAVPAPRAVSFFGDNTHNEVESRESLMTRYSSAIPPRSGSSSRALARRSASRARGIRGSSAYPETYCRLSSIERYVPNSATEEYEQLLNAKYEQQKRAQSCAYQSKMDTVTAAQNALNDRKKQRQLRAQSEIMHSEVDHCNDALNRGKFRDHYTNEFVWVEKNHITDVGVKYDGLSRRVDHKPSHWRCEDEIERGKEYKRLNDECADKIADNRFSIDNSRDWLVNDGGVIDRVHRMSAKTAQTRYDLDSIKRNMENLKAMRTRLLKYWEEF